MESLLRTRVYPCHLHPTRVSYDLKKKHDYVNFYTHLLFSSFKLVTLCCKRGQSYGVSHGGGGDV
jgi:hypothetical protein